MPDDRDLAAEVAALAVHTDLMARIRAEVERLYREELSPEEAREQLVQRFGDDEAMRVLLAAALRHDEGGSLRSGREQLFLGHAHVGIADAMRASGAAKVSDLPEELFWAAIDEAGAAHGFSSEVAREVFVRKMGEGPSDA